MMGKSLNLMSADVQDKRHCPERDFFVVIGSWTFCQLLFLCSNELEDSGCHLKKTCFACL
jgi:hypothetical protein